MIPYVSAPSSDWWTQDHVVERFNAKPIGIDIDEATFPVSLS